MKMELYAIRDRLINYGEPLSFVNEAVAVRAFGNSAKDKNSQIWQNAADIELWKIGTYDTEEGTIEPMKPKMICRAANFREVNENE